MNRYIIKKDYITGVHHIVETTKNDYITEVYYTAQKENPMRDCYKIASNIEKNLTVEIFNFLKYNSIDFNLEELNFFCLTDVAVKTYRKDIKKFSISDYETKINNLKRIADRIQYYSTKQIEIVLPHYPINANQLIYLFTNTLMKHGYSKKFVEKFLNFWSIQKNGTVNISFNSSEEVYRPDLKNSYKYIIANINLLEDNMIIEKQNMRINKIKECIANNFSENENYTNNSEYHKEHANYKDINDITLLKKEVEKLLTYDTADTLDYLEKKIDLFSIWIFLDSVKNYKFLIYSDLSSLDGTKFRKKIKTLKMDVDTLQYYSKNTIKIDIPQYHNENIFFMIKHLSERGLSNDDIDILLSIFKDRTRRPSIDNYIKSKQNILDEAQSHLNYLYENKQPINPLKRNAHINNDFSWENAIVFSEKLQLIYTATSHSEKVPFDRHQDYIEKILNIISVFDIDKELICDREYKIKILKTFTLFLDGKSNLKDKELDSSRIAIITIAKNFLSLFGIYSGFVYMKKVLSN